MDMKDFYDSKPNKFLVVLGKMQASLNLRLEKHLRELGVNHSEFLVMYAIAIHGPLTIQDIAARIFVTSGNMTYTIDKLEKRGLLQRKPCAEDRRRTYIDFTDAGNEAWPQMIEAHSQFLEQMFGDIDEDMMDQTIAQMKHIGTHIN